MAEKLTFEFGPFVVDSTSRRLLRKGEVVHLTPKAFDTLLFLIENRGRVVAKEELIQAIWPGTFVEENNLTQHISVLRKTLGDCAIETVPRRGYRFTCPSPAAQRPSRRYPMLAAVIAIALLTAAMFQYAGWSANNRIMIAVLPFENLSGDPKQEYFSDGLTEEMIGLLGRMYPERLGVIARTSVKQYKGASKRIDAIARDLKVDYLVEGSVRREGNTVRISAQLIQASDQTHLWAETYERDIERVLSTQAEIALAVAHGIEGTLRPSTHLRLASGRVVKPEAHEAYLRGQYWKAIKLDPNYAEAYAAAANAHYNEALWGAKPPGEAFSKAKLNAERALSIDPGLGSALGMLGLYKLHYEFDPRSAEADLRRAVGLNPSDGVTRHYYAHVLLALNREKESVAESSRAAEHDPFNSGLVACVAWHSLYGDRYDTAIDAARRALAVNKKSGFALLVLGWAYEQQKRYGEALGAFQEASHWGFSKPSIARGLAGIGDRQQSLQLLDELLQKAKSTYVSAYEIALIYERLGDTENALGWLEKAVEERSGYVVHAGWDPRLKSLRQTPRFRALLQRMRLPS